VRTEDALSFARQAVDYALARRLTSDAAVHRHVITDEVMRGLTPLLEQLTGAEDRPSFRVHEAATRGLTDEPRDREGAVRAVMTQLDPLLQELHDLVEDVEQPPERDLPPLPGLEQALEYIRRCVNEWRWRAGERPR
jgi:hypothetical protein